MSEHHYSSFAKFILAEWTILNNLIRRDTNRHESSVEEEETSVPHPLSDQQVSNALHSPYAAFYQDFIIGFTKMMRIKTEINIRTNETFSQNRPTLPDGTKLSEKQLSKITMADLDQIASQLKEQATHYHQLWEERLPQWSQLILDALSESGINLSILEISEFHTYEPMHEIVTRFSELKITPPKQKEKLTDFQYYLYLRAYLLVQGALSRQHQAHADNDVQATLKKIKSVFSTIHSQEQQLVKEQQHAINTATHLIS